MNLGTFGGDGPRSGIRVSVDAPMVTGAVGTWRPVTFNAVSPREIAFGWILVDGRLVAPWTQSADVMGAVRYTGALLLLAFEFRVVVEPVGGGADIVIRTWSHPGITSGARTHQFVADVPVDEAGDRIRLDVRSTGVGGVSIGAGDTNTWIKVREP